MESARIYEYMFVTDPRLSDEEVITLTDEYVNMIESGGGEILKRESWGKRKLAYPIRKLGEGKYMLLYVGAEGGGNPLSEVERRMGQNDQILRYLTVRTDRPVGAEDDGEDGGGDAAGEEE